MKIKTSDIMVCRELSVDNDWVGRMVYYSEEKSLLMSKKIIDMFLTEVKMLHKHRNIRAEKPARGDK